MVSGTGGTVIWKIGDKRIYLKEKPIWKKLIILLWRRTHARPLN